MILPGLKSSKPAGFSGEQARIRRQVSVQRGSALAGPDSWLRGRGVSAQTVEWFKRLSAVCDSAAAFPDDGALAVGLVGGRCHVQLGSDERICKKSTIGDFCEFFPKKTIGNLEC